MTSAPPPAGLARAAGASLLLVASFLAQSHLQELLVHALDFRNASVLSLCVPLSALAAGVARSGLRVAAPARRAPLRAHVVLGALLWGGYDAGAGAMGARARAAAAAAAAAARAAAARALARARKFKPARMSEETKAKLRAYSRGAQKKANTLKAAARRASACAAGDSMTEALISFQGTLAGSS
jgi:hypothetical protein